MSDTSVTISPELARTLYVLVFHRVAQCERGRAESSADNYWDDELQKAHTARVALEGTMWPLAAS